MLHATGALLSDSALPVLLCCSALTKRTVKWLFQSPHSSDMGVQPTSCTSRNRKCVKRSLLPPPWLSCVPAKVLFAFSQNRFKQTKFNNKGGHCDNCIYTCIFVCGFLCSVSPHFSSEMCSAQISPYSPNPRFSRFIDMIYSLSIHTITVNLSVADL